MKNLQERQEFLYNKKGFVCSCDICQDEEIKAKVDVEKYEKFQRLHDDVRKTKEDFVFGKYGLEKKLDIMEKVVSGRKQMYNFVKSNYPKDKKVLLNGIIQEAFIDAESGYSVAQAFLIKNPKHLSSDRKKVLEKMVHFKEECGKLSKVGYHISKMISGDGSRMTIEWNEMNQNFECWSKKYNKHTNDKKWFKEDRKYLGEMKRFYMPYGQKETVESQGQILKYGKMV